MHSSNLANLSRKRTIFVPLMGGLGNQLFQLSAGIYLGGNLSRHVVYSPQFFDVSLPSRLTQREFRIQTTLKPSEIVIWPKWKMGTALVLSRLGHPSFVRELAPSDDCLLNCGHSLRFAMGFFQREMFVSASWNQLQDRLANSKEFAAVLPRSPNGSFVLHIRRGDYLATGTRSFHGYTNLSYFENAHMRIRSLLGARTLRVISDDIEGAQLQLSESNYFKEVETVFEHQSNDLESLKLMANASAVIASNSTFSWWGARLCHSVGGYVTVPRPWYANPSQADIYMHPVSDRWLILERTFEQ